MKCPKCGYQSFNYLAECKKCGRDLTELRDKYGLGDPVLPGIDTAPPADPLASVDEDLFAAPVSDAGGLFTDTAGDLLPEEGTEAELAADIEAIAAMDPELAETLDPDSGWDPDNRSAEMFGFDGVAPEVEPADEDTPFPAEAPGEEIPICPPESAADEALPPADAEWTAAGPDDDDDDAADAREETGQAFAVQDFADEEDVDLDEWLLDGEEPSWRRSPPAAAEEESPGIPVEPSQDDPPEAEGGLFPLFDAALAGSAEQAELPFDNATELPSSPRAAWSARLLAGFLDAGLLAAALVLFVLAGEYLRRGEGTFAWPQPQDLATQAGPYFLVLFGLAFGYFTLFHYLSGQTPGKMAGKLLVVDVGGEPLQLSQAFLRSVGGLLCLLPAGLGFCSALFNRRGRGWNDLLAGSVVVPADQAYTEEGPSSF